MKIALLSPGVTPFVLGGIQRHSFNLAKHLAAMDVKVDLYHTNFGDALDLSIDKLENLTNFEKKNITSIVIPWPQKKYLPGHYIRSLKIFSSEIYQEYLKRSAPEFVYGKSLTAWAFIRAKKSGEKIPPIGVNLHGFEMFQKPANLKSRLENYMLCPDFSIHAHRADYLFSYGGKITELIHNKLRILDEKIIEIPGGINSSWLVKRPNELSEPIRFVFAGRFERRKGIEELHDAIQGNRDWEKRAVFRFVGPIPEVKRLHLPHVSYTGPIYDEALLQHEFRQADFLLCPSHSEGMPNTILEGMASGLAVLATDVGAVRLLVNSSNGVLLPKVTISGLIEGINQLLSKSEGEIMKMKRASLTRIENFTWEKVSAQTLNHIQKIVAKA